MSESAQPRAVAKRFLGLFLPLAFVCLTGGFVVFRTEMDADLLKLRASETATMQVGTSSIDRLVQTVTSDLTYLVAQKEMLDLTSREEATTHGVLVDDHLLADWRVFSRAKGTYDQIRWLGPDGRERARVDFNDGAPAAVPRDELQDKSERYYFTEAIELDRGQFFISPLDLNVEAGEIEEPTKPTIRVATPVFDRTGSKQGIVLLNYLGDRMLDEYGRSMGGAAPRAWLLDPDGYWLKGPSPELEWGFMYPRPEATMKHHHADAWRRMLGEQRGQFENDHGLWTFATVHPLNEDQRTRSDPKAQDYTWKAVLLLAPRDYHASLWQTGPKFVATMVLLLAAAALGCWRLALARLRQRTAEAEVRQVNEGLVRTVQERTAELAAAKTRAEEEARKDALTGMNNRRAFSEYGEIIDRQASRYGHAYAVLMMDIDRFKKINDSFGHFAGDEVLRAVARSVHEVIRDSDFAGRIGGEEFAITMPDTSCEEARGLAERLRQTLESLVVPVEADELRLTVSIGIAAHRHEDSCFEEVLMRADAAMYRAKEQGRNRVVLDAAPETSRPDTSD